MHGRRGAALAAQSQRIEGELIRHSSRIFELAGGEFNINSPKQLGEVLFDKLQLPVLKRTGTTRTPSLVVTKPWLQPRMQVST